jgi:hypothetical protein|nr:MAG TPA: hypothetical protein [Caudoviricetes sp.]
MYDGEKLQILLQKNKNIKLKDAISYSMMDPTDGFKFLISIKNDVDLEAYAMYVRILTQTDTQDVPLEVLLKAYEGLKQEDLMSKEEIDKLASLPDELTIYRGTDSSEYPPRISWSLLESKARTFENGRMYKAIINKKDIFAYYSSNGDEEEIIAHVTDNYDVIF